MESDTKNRESDNRGDNPAASEAGVKDRLRDLEDTIYGNKKQEYSGLKEQVKTLESGWLKKTLTVSVITLIVFTVSSLLHIAIALGWLGGTN